MSNLSVSVWEGNSGTKNPEISFDTPFGLSILRTTTFGLGVKVFIKNELIIITLPTPKQEIIAEHIARNNLKFKIICAGASIAMLSGEEKIVPKFLEFFGLEFLWRLRKETRRRLIRLFQTAIYFINGFLNNKLKNIKIEKI